MSDLYLFVSTGQVQDATHKLNELKTELQKSGLGVSELTTVSLYTHTNMHTVLLLFALCRSMHLIPAITYVFVSVCVSVQLPAIDKVINGKKAILTKMENQPRRKCNIPDPFKGNPQVLGKVCLWFLYAFVFASGDPITSQQGKMSLGKALHPDQYLKKSFVLIERPTLAC